MKAQCPKCKTLFNIHDEKIPERGAHVICSKCQTRFEIKKTVSAPKNEPAVQTLITCPSCSHVNLSLDKCVQCGYIFSDEDRQKNILKI